MNEYHINIFFSKEDEGYIADIPDLNACSAFGDTPERALQEVLIAKKLWLETASSNGIRIPKPMCRPSIIKKTNQRARCKALKGRKMAARRRW